MSYQRIITALYSEPWLATPDFMRSAHQIVERRLEHDRSLIPDAAEAVKYPSREAREEMSGGSDGIGIIRVFGPLGKHLTFMERMCSDACSMDDIETLLLAAERDESIHTVLLDISSPGGLAVGTPELGKLIKRVTQTKDVVGYTSMQAASAAYWLMSQCDYCYAAPSAHVGSIGVYLALLDYSEWMANEGLKLELFKAGRLKATGLPGKPLTDEERDMLQSRVDSIYADFTAAVRSGRGDVDEETMQGQTFQGTEAVERNLLDGLYDSLGDLVGDWKEQRKALGLGH